MIAWCFDVTISSLVASSDDVSVSDVSVTDSMNVGSIEGQIEVEADLSGIECSVEVENFAEVAVRVESIAIADEVPLGSDPANRGTNHQKRAIEPAPVEGDEAIITIEVLPEFFEDLLLCT